MSLSLPRQREPMRNKELDHRINGCPQDPRLRGDD